MIYFYAQARCASCKSDDKITTGSVGIQVLFHFSEHWTNLRKVAVFKGSGQSVDVVLSGDSCTVPPEVLAAPGDALVIGVYGSMVSDEEVIVAIPTVYAEAGRILRGAVPSGIEPTPETASLIDQLLAAAQAARDAADAAERLAQSVRDAADAGEFDGAPGGPGPTGPQGAPGPKGDDYVLTAADRAEIAGMAADECVLVSDTQPGGETQPRIWIDSDDGSTVRLPTMADIGELSDLATTDKSSIVAAINEAARSGGADLSAYRTAAAQDEIDNAQNAAITAKYTKPSDGIPASDLAAGVIPTVPSNVSAFSNDAKYLTLATLPVYSGGVS